MKKDINEVIAISARATCVVKEGQVETIIDGYLITFTVQQYSYGFSKVLLNEDTTKSRKILVKYGVKFEPKSNCIKEGNLHKYICYIYAKSVIDNDGSWKSWEYDSLSYKEIK